MTRPHQEGQAVSPLASNRAFAICLAVLLAALLVYLLTSPETFRELRDGFYLGIIPVLTVAGMLVCAITMVFDGKRGEPFHASDDYRLTLPIVGLAIGALLSIYVFYRAILFIGFPLASLLYLAGLMFALGVRAPAVIAIASASMTALVYAAFSLLGFALPVWPF